MITVTSQNGQHTATVQTTGLSMWILVDGKPVDGPYNVGETAETTVIKIAQQIVDNS